MTSIQAANLSDPGQARLVIVGGLSGALAAEGRTAEHHAKTGGVKRALPRLARGGVASSDFHRRFADPVPSNFSRPLKASGGLHSSLRDQAAKHARCDGSKKFRPLSVVVVHESDNSGAVSACLERVFPKTEKTFPRKR